MNTKSQLDMYIDVQHTLLDKYDGKILALQDGKVLGQYDSKLDAYRAVCQMGLRDGEYIIVQCSPGNTGYTSYYANLHVIGDRALGYAQ